MATIFSRVCFQILGRPEIVMRQNQRRMAAQTSQLLRLTVDRTLQFEID